MMYRQGDVMLIAAELPGGGLREVARDRGRVVLAYGEATGHAHAIEVDWVTQLEDEANQRWLDVHGKSAALVHEEHDTITVPPGTYRVVRQREYEGPESSRTVGD